jgi:DNA-binding transcriptional LysR family regulator
MLDLRLLETFREVATRGSFSAAAEALSFTQPAVSQHVARLEKALGLRLFDRDARGVTLTRAGHTLLRHAEGLLEGARRAEADVRAEAGLHVPEARIGAFPSAAAALVPAALRELRTALPEVRPRLHVVEPDAALEGLRARRLDVGLLVDSVTAGGPETTGLETEVLLDDPMVVALPSGHPLARRRAVAIADLRDEEWLVSDATCPDAGVAVAACRAAGFEPSIHFRSGDYAAVLGLAASGMGVALIPSLAITGVRDDVALRAVDGEAPVRRILAAVRAGEDDPVVAATLDALRVAGRRLSLAVAPAVAA